MRVELLPSHLPSHYPHTSGTGKYIVRGLLQNLTKVPEKYSCLVPTVQHRYTNSIAMLHYQYSYAGLLVQGCCTFGARVLHFYWHYYSKVFTVAFLAVAEPRFFCNTILNSIIGFPSGRRTSFLNRRSRQFFILHSSFFILHSNCCIALCKPAATELESKKRSRIFFGVFSRIRFLIFLFDFLLTWIVP